MAVLDAQGTLIRIDGTLIGNLRGFSGIGSGQAGERDRTTLDTSDFKKFAIGLQDGGSISLDAFPDPEDPGQRLCFQAYTVRDEHAFTITFKDGTVLTFNGYIRQFSMDGNQDADVTGTIQVRVNGALSGWPAPA